MIVYSFVLGFKVLNFERVLSFIKFFYGIGGSLGF